MSMGLFDRISKRHLTRRPYCAALVPAAGKSERMGGTDKLTAQLGGIPVLERTLLALDGASLVDEIVVAVSPERLEELAALCARVGVKKPLRAVEGGASRAQSVLLAALGDIGKLFPDSEAAYAGADSIALLERVTALLREHGWQVGNVDATVVAQAPRLAPYIPEMRRRLAEAMGLDVDCVSVKATTEERLGFTGSGEGMAAHAVALIERLN